VLKEGLADESKRDDAEMVVTALYAGLEICAKDVVDMRNGGMAGNDEAQKVVEKIGEVLGNKVIEAQNPLVVKAVLDVDLNL